MGVNGPAPKKGIVLGGPLDGERIHLPYGDGRNTLTYRVPGTNRFHRYRWSGAAWEHQGPAKSWQDGEDCGHV